MLIYLSSSILQEASDSIREVSGAIRADQKLRKEKEDGDVQSTLSESKTDSCQQ
jgi:hypothetical protein